MAAELNIEAERREFEAEVLKLNPNISLDRWPAGHYKHHAVDGHWRGWQLARRADLASCEIKELPPLPQPMRKVYERPHGEQELFYFTADMMRDYARAALRQQAMNKEG